MKKRLLISILIITMSLAAITGGTLAWYTAESNEIVNTFTAGTLEITASEEVSWSEGLEYDGSVGSTAPLRENWNPGDCDWKEFTIKNTGTKGIYLRAQFTHSWDDSELSDENITVSEVGSNWKEIDGYYYYKGDINGTYVEEDEEDRTITLRIDVCLDGRTTGNEYKGKSYTFTAQFQAIQRSHEAVMDDATYEGWGVGFIDVGGDSDWYKVVASGETWKANVGTDTDPVWYIWDIASQTWSLES